MADVFLSYAREDTARAELVARGLEQAGLDVFWDNEIPPGQTWADYIEHKLTQCKALIVLWSEHSTKSQWVREEARMGRDKGVLIPVMIDNSQPPFGFGEVQAANLANWNGEAENANWKRFVSAVMSFAKEGAPRPAPQPAMSAPPRAPATVRPVAATVEKKKGGVPVWVWVSGAVVAVIAVLLIGAAVTGEQVSQQQIAGTTPIEPAVSQPQVGAVPPQAAAQPNYQQQILDRLTQVQQAFATQGFQQIGQPFVGQLPQAQYFNLPPVTLEVGGDYRIIGVCDSDCGDLDLILYDENNNVISQDNLTDATPIVSVAPRWTGQFVVQASMHNCTVAPCYYAVVLYGRPLQ